MTSQIRKEVEAIYTIVSNVSKAKEQTKRAIRMNILTEIDPKNEKKEEKIFFFFKIKKAYILWITLNTGKN